MSRTEDTFRVMVWGGLCRSRLLVVTPQHLRRAVELVLVLVAWRPLEVGAEAKGQAVSGTRRGQGYVGTVWTWLGLHFLCNCPLTSSCKSVSLVWQWRAWSAGSPCGTGIRRRLCEVADCGLEPKKWKCIILVSLQNQGCLAISGLYFAALDELPGVGR